MNWFEIVNKTTEYIEDHITEDIVLEDIATLCHVSYYYFVKTFSMMTGYTLKEYIRNRRITLASYEVSNTDHHLIDIAIKYGYSSNESFSRAFKKIHGINPSQARKNHVSVYTHFPVLTYEIPKQNMISLSYDIVRDMHYSLIGKKILLKETLGQFDSSHQQQLDFINAFKKDYPSRARLFKVHADMSSDFTVYDFIVGYESNHYQHDRLESFQINISKAVRFIAKGIDKHFIYDIKQIIYKEWEKNGFESDHQYEIETTIDRPNNQVDFYYIVSIN